MKNLSKDELEKIASEYLKGDVLEVHATSDGQVFYDKNLAENHTKKRNLALYSFAEAEAEVEAEAEAEVEVEAEAEVEAEKVIKKTKTTK